MDFSLLTSRFVVMLLLVAPLSVRAASDTDRAVEKTVKGLVGAIRYSKDATASKLLAFDAMGMELLGEDWKKLSPAEQTEVADGLATIVKTITFPKGRDIFQYLDALLFEPARVAGDRAQVKTTFVVHRQLKKTEVVFEWVLIQQGTSWKVLDTVMLGESTLQSLRNEQVIPLLKQGGTQAVMKALRDQVATVKKG